MAQLSGQALWKAIRKFDLPRAVERADAARRDGAMKWPGGWKQALYLPLCGFARPIIHGGVLMAMRHRQWKDAQHEQFGDLVLRLRAEQRDEPGADVYTVRRLLCEMEPRRREVLEAAMLDRRQVSDIAADAGESRGWVKQELGAAIKDLKAAVRRDRTIREHEERNKRVIARLRSIAFGGKNKW